jgi:hypothetical protein
VRYWYYDDGELLAVGSARVTLVSGQVADLAGRANPGPTAFSFTVFWPWQNPVFAPDVSHDMSLEPLDALLPINYINSHGSGLLPIPTVPPNARPHTGAASQRKSGIPAALATEIPPVWKAGVRRPVN